MRELGGALLLSVALLVPALPGQTKTGGNPPQELSTDQKIVHLLNRFAFGPTPELLARVKQQGLEAWLEDQLADRVEPSQVLEARLAPAGSLGLTNLEILERYNRSLPPKPTAKQRREYNRDRNRPKQEVRDAVLYRAVYAPNQVREVAADFFRNHFNVTAEKGNCRFFTTTYERDVIRAEALGNFGRMLLASAKHPAMLIYLDNVLSRRPPSKHDLKVVARHVRQKTKSKRRAREAVDIAKQRGLNENYARELLELHTLGVDHYYTQKDVIEVARALTGWTVQMNRKKPIAFEFRKDMHCEGDKFFLGRRVAERKKDPVQEGEVILRRLIRHPGTAEFLAFKLCRHLVNDQPPEDLVKRIAFRFTQAGGDLPDVYRAIVKDPEFFRPRNYGAKFKRPFEFVVSALRATGAEVQNPRGIHLVLRELNEPIYACEDPTGYYDQAEAWRDPGVMAIRWGFAIRLATDRIPGVKLPPGYYDALARDAHPLEWKKILTARILPGGASAATSKAVEEAIYQHLRQHRRPDRGKLGPLILALLIGSPDFQRQ